MTASCRSKNTASNRRTRLAAAMLAVAVTAGLSAPAAAQSAPAVRPAMTTTAAAPAPPSGVAVPADYVIGADDVLTVLFWRDKDMSSDVTVRPDGRISLPLVNEVQAAGLTPDQLRDAVTKVAVKYVADPSVTVVVKQINSRKAFITGQVSKPGAYTLNKPTTVLQLISMAGGLLDFAKGKEIVIARNTDGQQQALKFNYKDVLQGRNLAQNVFLKPGDTVLVP